MEDFNKFEPILTIGTVAKYLEIAVQTVRLYEAEGLIIPHKTTSGRRMYSFHDLDRLKCIRKMITQNGLNIQGIKRLMSLIPCWEFKGGLDEECTNCQAYYEATGPCWQLKNVGKKCQDQNCRDCVVYKTEFNCQKLKSVIYNHKQNN